MGSNDIRKVKARRVDAQKGKKYRNPVYFMEKQATRGAFGLMMPVSHTREMIINQSIKATGYQNFGEKFQIVGIELARSLHLPHFRVRARMIQLGFIEAKGALNYVSGGLIDPFAFDLEAWKESDISFVIDPCSVDRLYESEFDRRHQALEYIRTVLWDRGIKEANEYLASKGLDPLEI